MVTNFVRKEHPTYIIQTCAITTYRGTEGMRALFNSFVDKISLFPHWHVGYVGIPLTLNPVLSLLQSKYDSDNASPSLYSAMHDIPGGCTFLKAPASRHWSDGPESDVLFPKTHAWFGWDIDYGDHDGSEAAEETLTKTLAWADLLLLALTPTS